MRVRVDGREYRGHRIIWEMHNGEIQEGYLVDHINGDRKDNRIENLRVCTRQQNNLNSASKGAKFKGVTRVGNSYRAKINYKGVAYSLGSYKTPEEASAAYEAKALELHGEFAFCNRPEKFNS